MTLQRLFRIASSATLVVFLSAPSYGFMADESDAEAPTQGIAAVAEQLKNELDGGEIECKVMLEKLNATLTDIDAKLDAGVSDEVSYLKARDQVVEMRLSLPCLGEELTQVPGEPVPAPGTVISDEVVGEQVIGSSIVDGVPMGGGMSGSPIGSMAGGGGAGGGGLLGGGIGGAGALAAAAAVAIAVPLATSDDPGNDLSPATP